MVTTHAISADYSGFNRMSPTAAALAVLLHVLTALALWWVSPLHQRNTDVDQEPIEVTIEQPKVQQPPPPPQVQPQPQPQPQPEASPKPAPPPPKATPNPAAAGPARPLGLPPEPPKTDKKADESSEKNDTKTKPEAASKPPPETPKVEEPKPEPQQQAVAPPPPPPPPPPPEPPLEKSLPPVETPPPPVTSRDIPKVPLPTPPKVEPKPEPKPVPKAEPRPAPHPQQQARPSPLQPSPLHSAPTQRPPQTNDDSVSTTFVNPANNYGTVQAKQSYMDMVARRLSTARFVPRDSVAYTGLKGVIGVNMVVARDGRLVNISIARSSGAPTFDAEMMQFLRGLSPYPPLPSDLGSEYAFMLPIPFNLNPGVQ